MMSGFFWGHSVLQYSVRWYLLAGRNALPNNVRDPVATDPFMMGIVSTLSWDDEAAFGTPLFLDVQGGVQVRGVYDYIAIWS